jgi:NADP-dependent 3-hydroxy acid dehydrogenase YdfG
MTDLRPFAGRTAVVTGASSGIGRAIAERLGGDGASVHLIGRTESAMAASAEVIRGAGGEAAIHTLDVTDDEGLVEVISSVARDAGRLDVMVNNAGVGHNGPILTGEVGRWREMFEVNVVALIVGAQAAVAAMRATGSSGHLVNISSTAALTPDSGVYGSTKAAVSYLSAGLRQELEQDPIRVTALLPGVVATNFARNLSPETIAGIGALAGVDIDFTPGERLPDEVLDAAAAALETHIARPEDVADAVAYVVSLPVRLNIPEIVVRPAVAMSLA